MGGGRVQALGPVENLARGNHRRMRGWHVCVRVCARVCVSVCVCVCVHVCGRAGEGVCVGGGAGVWGAIVGVLV